ncbi:peptide chain release factor N(5)-glutamine methyltransferase [Pararhizobium haloflavum]|uniref:peptide chain release factor N(5)-glutamine methyltransferase n=1 Tax=Pararhizobium haloflavum TaxID=2037914 RepID=UPI000C18F612|nr:peptide chain release factor N(5)-glutamine methyltransferase [Pararhizobium haloflavum]
MGAIGPTIGEAMANLRQRLRAAGITNADFDARLLLTETLGIELTDLVVRPDMPVEHDGLQVLEARISRRIAGEPVHRILGHRAFFDLDLMLSPETLEPRPDTEILVEAVSPIAAATIERKGECAILDLGTGTGAIALALLARFPGARAKGTDLAAGALETARLNAQRHGLEPRFETLESCWFSAIDGKFDIIVSNPPYIRTEDMDSLAIEVGAHDPRLALDGGISGLDAYQTIAAEAAPHLYERGALAVEIGHDQRHEVTAVFVNTGFRLKACHVDLGGRDRVLVFEAPEQEQS